MTVDEEQVRDGMSLIYIVSCEIEDCASKAIQRSRLGSLEILRGV